MTGQHQDNYILPPCWPIKGDIGAEDMGECTGGVVNRLGCGGDGNILETVGMGMGRVESGARLDMGDFKDEGGETEGGV